ncbi:hypothetical protein [uncultured Chryseobacterium sp.]|uniref:hypothetical protein n=2 Tax=uncultured Chryseobacterium sp. TaxID=259322 RepID=UPI0025D0F6F6|nr:hypothetical protein [uncultured Chryseobacterium sp.]
MIKEQNAHLDSLSEMANIKVNLFKEIITDQLINAGTGTDKTVPITQIQDFISETHAYTSQNADKIAGAVENAINGIINGGKENINNAISGLVTAAITGLFGSQESSDMTFDKYYVAVEGISIIRLDLMGWKRAITASSLSERVEQVSAFVMAKSTVDIMKTDFNTFLDLYQNLVLSENPDAKTKDIITDAKQIFDMFKSNEKNMNVRFLS